MHALWLFKWNSVINDKKPCIQPLIINAIVIVIITSPLPYVIIIKSIFYVIIIKSIFPHRCRFIYFSYVQNFIYNTGSQLTLINSNLNLIDLIKSKILVFIIFCFSKLYLREMEVKATKNQLTMKGRILMLCKPSMASEVCARIYYPPDTLFFPLLLLLVIGWSGTFLLFSFSLC